MTNEISKKEEKEITPVPEIENRSAKETAFRFTRLPYLESEALKKLLKIPPEGFANLKDYYSSGVDKAAEIVSMANGLESGYALTESVDRKYRPLALVLKEKLEKEFDCKCPSEKMLVEQAVNAHIRTLYYSRIMDGSIFLAAGERESHESNRFLAFLSKEIYQASRQCISAIETLKSSKQPSPKISIRTQNAFLGEKQQFNTNVENNEAK
jgi:hypothetical protein